MKKTEQARELGVAIMGQKFLWWGFVALMLLQGGCAYKLVCYFTNWAQYRAGLGYFVPDTIDPHLCTHLIYSFANISNNKITSEEWNDVTLYHTFNDLKKRNPNLKTLLSIGGAKFGSKGFHPMVDSSESRSTFINSVIPFLRHNGFNGLDVDWIYPELNEKPFFASLIHELAVAFQEEAKNSRKEKLLLSAGVAAGRQKIDNSYEIKDLANDVDFINLLSFDFHGFWDNPLVTGHNSPLSKGSQDQRNSAYYNVEYAANYWKKQGMPGEKIIMGIPLYGRSFTLSTPASNSGVGAPANGAGTPGQFTAEGGFLAYYEVCQFLEGATVKKIPEQQVPYAVKGNQWVGFDDVESVKTKVQYLKNARLGGAMIWSIDLDDFTGKFCKKGSFPLLQAIKKTLDSANKV
ncbi:chitinase-3-like protein 2 isoform X2 [Phascolarctos cinereus]|uniref:Chitinase-3-like protein 2 isoform X1 n=2 Tax=Phascolarctos cinereus TaxID=38626 RepID=A0A6P5LMM5_PHACI|nr:chitinase-3-like protein 2 isoform X1 [Phascolarctos cinereus]